MTDRKICRKCIHAVFSDDRFKYCNYLDDTGERRPHDGNTCYGLEHKNGQKRKPQLELNRQRHKLSKSDGLKPENAEKVQKSAEKPPKNVQKAAETVKKAAEKITKQRNKSLDNAVIIVQHIGDGFNRIFV